MRNIFVLLCISLSVFLLELVKQSQSVPIDCWLHKDELDALQLLYVKTKGHGWNWRSDVEESGAPWRFPVQSVRSPCKDEWQGVSCRLLKDKELRGKEEEVDGGNNSSSGQDGSKSSIKKDGIVKRYVTYKADGSTDTSLTYDRCSVSRLSLPGYNLQGKLPNIAGLKRLRYLDLSNNQLVGSIPSEIRSMKKLTQLYLTNNPLMLGKEVVATSDNISEEGDLNLEQDRAKRFQNVSLALGFFGLARSMSLTLESIKNLLFKPLQENNVKFDVYLHTYSLKATFTNLRTGEINERLNNDEYKTLNPDFYLVEDKDEVSKKLALERYRSLGDPWAMDFRHRNGTKHSSSSTTSSATTTTTTIIGNFVPPVQKNKTTSFYSPTNFSTLDNHVLYLWSQRQLTKMMLGQISETNYKTSKFKGSSTGSTRSNGGQILKYTHVIFLRPDVVYKVPLDVGWILRSSKTPSLSLPLISLSKISKSKSKSKVVEEEDEDEEDEDIGGDLITSLSSKLSSMWSGKNPTSTPPPPLLPLNMQKGTILIPNFGLFKNMNDRFAIGPFHLMMQYGSRFDKALEFSQTFPLHSETFLKDYLRTNYIRFSYVNFYFIRVRAGLKLSASDVEQIGLLEDLNNKIKESASVDNSSNLDFKNKKSSRKERSGRFRIINENNLMRADIRSEVRLPKQKKTEKNVF